MMRKMSHLNQNLSLMKNQMMNYCLNCWKNQNQNQNLN